jgi:hypothetical protein
VTTTNEAQLFVTGEIDDADDDETVIGGFVGFGDEAMHSWFLIQDSMTQRFVKVCPLGCLVSFCHASRRHLGWLR